MKDENRGISGGKYGLQVEAALMVMPSGPKQDYWMIGANTAANGGQDADQARSSLVCQSYDIKSASISQI